MWPLVRNGPFGDKDETLVDQIWILSLFIFDQPAAEWDKKGNECLFVPPTPGIKRQLPVCPVECWLKLPSLPPMFFREW